MPRYKYVAKNLEGKKVKGVYNADSMLDLLSFLDAQNLFLVGDVQILDIDETSVQTKKSTFGSNVPKQKVIEFLKVLKTLLKAGVTISDALAEAAETIVHKKLKSVLLDVQAQVKQGNSLGSALRNHTDVFSPSLVEAITTGEISGSLLNILDAQIEQLTNELKFEKSIKSQSTYPIILLSFVFVVFTLIVTWFIPKLMDSFKTLIVGNNIPPRTATILAINEFLQSKGIFIAGSFFAIALAWWLMKFSKPTKILRDRIVYRMPMVGKIVRYSNLIRASNFFKVGLSAGLDISDCLEAVQKGATNYCFSQIFAHARTAVETGATLSQAITPQDTDYMFYSMIRSGEISGRLEETMQEASDFYMDRTQDYLNTVLSFFNYLVLFVLGAIVGYTILSAVVPIYELPTVL